MNYRQIIADSWKYTQENRKLIYWFGFLPSILTTTVGIGYLTYQFFAFKKSYLFDDAETSFLHDVINYGWTFISTHASLTIPLIIIAIIVLVLWFLVPTLCMASAVQSIARAKNGQKSGIGVGLKFGILAFLPLLEFHAFLAIFTPFSIINEAGFVLRNLGVDLFQILLIPMILFLFIGLFLKLLFSYSDLYIIIDNEGVLSSMKKSVKLVIFNWQQTFLITLLMIIIGIRIVIQAVLVVLVPGILILLGGYFASLALSVVWIVILVIIGVAGLLFASYLGGVVDIFSYTVWTYTFLHLTNQEVLSARDEVIDTSVKDLGSTSRVVPRLRSVNVAGAGVINTAPRAEVPEIKVIPPRDSSRDPDIDENSSSGIPGVL